MACESKHIRKIKRFYLILNFPRIFCLHLFGVSHFILFWHVIKSEIMNIAPTTRLEYDFPFLFVFVLFHLEWDLFSYVCEFLVFGGTRPITIPDSINLSKRHARCTLDAHIKLITFRVGSIRGAVRGRVQKRKFSPLSFGEFTACTRQTPTRAEFTLIWKSKSRANYFFLFCFIRVAFVHMLFGVGTAAGIRRHMSKRVRRVDESNLQVFVWF